MKTAVKVLLVLAVVGGAGALALREFRWQKMHHYWEAEPMVGPVWNLAVQVGARRPLPASLDEMLASLKAEEQEMLRPYPMIWKPEGDPVFVVKINEQYGFLIGRAGGAGWLWGAEEVRRHFAK